MCRHCGRFERVLRDIFEERGWTYTLSLYSVVHHGNPGYTNFIFDFVHNGNPMWHRHTCDILIVSLEGHDIVPQQIVCNNETGRILFRLIVLEPDNIVFVV